MKFIKFTVILLLVTLLIWIDLPENFKISFTLFGKKITQTLNPPTINLFGYKKDIRTHLGLDLQGGSHLVFETNTSKLARQDIDDALESAKTIIERRVNFFGVSEPNVQIVTSQNIHRIIVDIPGITNTQEAIKLIGQTAQLEFTEEASDSGKIATDTPAIFLLTKKTNLSGQDVKKATVVFDQQTGNPQVRLDFNAEGAKKFGQITTRNVGKQVGIVIDNMMISAPVVQQPITDGTAIISGNFSLESAKQLAVAINSGALPIPIKIVEQRSIGPTLGAIEIQKSLYAGIVGLTMVVFFMILYYGKLGVIACIALFIYALITFAIFRSIPIVLTLPGVAGFILSIGMAVDANILIFERIREELRKGKDFAIAVRLGFGRAIDAIKDANVTTIVVALILFNPLSWDFLPQSGLVRGFAVTLLIGVSTSLFTGIVITKRLIYIFFRRRMEVFSKRK